MGEYNQQVQSLFETQTVNEAGIYMMYLYVNGYKTPVIVDDWVPCKYNGFPFAAGTKT